MNKIHLELGAHATDPVAIDGIVNDFLNGTFAYNTWPRSTAQSLARQNLDCLLVDGSSAAYMPPQGEQLAVDQLGQLWTSLPASPAELNTSGRIIIGAGDAITLPVELGALDFYAPRPGFWLQKWMKPEIQLAAALASSAYVGYAAGQAAGGVINTITDSLTNRGTNPTRVREALFPGLPAETEDTDPTVNDNYRRTQVSRRKLLGMLGGIIGTSALFGVDSLPYNPTTPHTAVAKFLSKDEGFANRWHADGRTALLIEKALQLEASENMKVGVVLGSDHDHHAKEFLSSASARAEAIKDLTRKSLAMASQQSKHTRRLIKNIKTEVPAATLFEASEPEQQPGTSYESYGKSLQRVQDVYFDRILTMVSDVTKE